MKKRSVQKSISTPTAIKAIVVIDVLAALFLLFIGISFMLGSMAIQANPEEAAAEFLRAAQSYPSLQFTEADAKAYVLRIAEVAPAISAGLFLLAMINALLAVFLWKRKSWARTAQVIIAMLGMLYSLLGISTGAIIFNVLVLLVEGWIASYLLFTPEGKGAFA